MTASRTAVVADPLGLHARPAADFVAQARTYESEIVLTSGDKSGNCKSLLGVLKLGIATGSEVGINATGPDELAAVEALAALLGREPDTGAS